jgi:hypothetical protein
MSLGVVRMLYGVCACMVILHTQSDKNAQGSGIPLKTGLFPCDIDFQPVKK